MCGIIGIVGREPAAERLIDGLRRLEYRGYDSAGLAVIAETGVERRRAPGKIANLDRAWRADPADGTTGVAHTRWATHGVPNEANAHPHIAGDVVVVTNGIVENYRELKARLVAKGRQFASETDSEIIAHLIDSHRRAGATPQQAAQQALDELQGAFAIVVMFADQPDLLIGARRGPPLAAGLGDGESYLGSDAVGLAPLTQRVIYLEDDDLAVCTRDGVRVFAGGKEVTRAVTHAPVTAMMTKGNYAHFMLKEIHEQPEVVGRTMARYISSASGAIVLPEGLDLAKFSRVAIAACGTASYAGLVGRYWLERLAGLPADVDVASEFRYRQPALSADTLAVFVSQSGETADTLAALRYCKQRGLTTLAIVNVPGSSMAREADVVMPTLAGPEIGVASTKAFTCQLAALACLAVGAAKARGRIDAKREAELTRTLMHAPTLINTTLKLEEQVREIATELVHASQVLYLGRGANYPLALEGALKLKEISYLHAEGYAAGELKHGPIALIEEGTPVVVIAPHDELYDKTASSIAEVAARGARVILISDAAGLAAAGPAATIEVPDCDPLIAPLVYAAPIQLLAYYTAVHKGTDVDQPRNLAKSVTVE
jgi:glucosamine--fructose-6-phosphate aminotransferase (isomerizing)